MSAPKKKLFRDKLQVHSTKAGSQFVRPSEVIRSANVKDDMRLIRQSFSNSESTQEVPKERRRVK